MQGNKPQRNSPEPFEPCLRNLHQHAPELFGTLRNLPNPASGTYTNTRRNSPEPSGTFRDLREPTCRNLPEPASGTYTILHRNLPEPSGTCLRNLHQHTPELSGTFRNLPPEPTPFYTGTFRNHPEPASGTYTSTRRNSPEPSGTFLKNLLLWPAPGHTGAYLGNSDSISLRCCWGKTCDEKQSENVLQLVTVKYSSRIPVGDSWWLKEVALQPRNRCGQNMAESRLTGSTVDCSWTSTGLDLTGHRIPFRSALSCVLGGARSTFQPIFQLGQPSQQLVFFFLLYLQNVVLIPAAWPGSRAKTGSSFAGYVSKSDTKRDLGSQVSSDSCKSGGWRQPHYMQCFMLIHASRQNLQETWSMNISNHKFTTWLCIYIYMYMIIMLFDGVLCWTVLAKNDPK